MRCESALLASNRSGTTIVRELDNYVAKGSQVTVVADIYNIEKQIKAQGGIFGWVSDSTKFLDGLKGRP